MAAGQQQLKEGEGEVLGGARPTVELRTVLEGTLERIHHEFGAMLQDAVSRNDADKKRLALFNLHSWRQQLLRMVSLVQWHPKAKALLPCVQQGQVLDTARRHAQVLDAAALELYNAHASRLPNSCPMADVQTALDVLSSGTYTDLPTSIAKLGKAGQHSPEQQRNRLRQISHLVLSHLLRATLPPNLEVSDVRNGYALLTCPGLYSAKVTLIPGAKLPPEPPSAAEQDATGSGEAGGAQSAAAAAKKPDEEEEEVTSGKPSARWKWLLLEFSIPVNMIRGEALQPAQKQGLLRDLNDRMDKAADHAVYELRRQQARTAAAPEAGAAGARAEAGVLQASASMGPQASLSKAAASTLTASSSRTGAGAGRAEKLRAQNLAMLEQHATDELTAPLVMMHVVLADVASRLVLDAARTVAQQLVGPSGCWYGHAQYQHGASSSALELGFSIPLWTKAIPLLPAPPTQAADVPGSTGAQTAAGQQQGMQQPSRPALEIGIATNGTVQVHLLGVHTALRRTGTVASMAAVADTAQASSGAGSDVSSGQQGPSLELDAVTVNIDELLLRAASRVAWLELHMIKDQLARELQSMSSAGAAWGLRLTTAHMQLLPATARQLLDQMTVQQAVLSCAPTATTAAAVGNARQGRAIQHATGSTALASSGSKAVVSDVAAATAVSTAGVTEELQMEVEFPVLEFWSQGELLVKLSKSLFTGRLLLQPGTGLAGDANLQALSSWGQKEEDINMLLARLHAQPVSTAASSGGAQAGPGHVVHELCQKLAMLLKEQQRSMAISKCMSTARQLHLHLGGPSTRVITAFHQENPWADVKRFYTLWSMPPTPFPSDFPTLHACQPGTHAALQPRCLSFVIGAADPSHAHPSYSLFVVACSAQMLPLSVVKAVPVPQHAFTACHKGDEPEVPQLQRLNSSYQSLSMLAGISGDPRELIAGGRMDIDGEITTVNAADRTTPTRTWSPSPFGRQQTTGQGRDTFVSGGGAASTSGGDVSAAATSVRDVHQELVRVVQWCKQRAVWEKLVAQLKAVSSEFVELPLSLDINSNLGWLAQPSVLLLSFAGVKVPCQIARRKGLQPGRVGPSRIVLSVGQNTAQEQVNVSLEGTWFSSNDALLLQPSIPQQGAGGISKLGEAQHPHSTVDHEPGAGKGQGHGQPQGWAGLRAKSCTQVSGRQVKLLYHFAQGHSVLDVLCDVMCVLRLQTFLARLESMAHGPGQLRTSRRQFPANIEQATQPQAAVRRAGMKREHMQDEDAELGPLPAKRARGMDGQTIPAAANGTAAANGNGHIQHANHHDGLHSSIAGNGVRHGSCSVLKHDVEATAGGTARLQPGITWAWPGNSTVQLASYSLTHATFTCTANNSVHFKSESENGKQETKLQSVAQLAQLSMTVCWQRPHSSRHDVAGQSHGAAWSALGSAASLTSTGSAALAAHAHGPPSSTAATSAIASTAAHLRWADLVKCHITMHDDHGRCTSADQSMQACQAACACTPATKLLPLSQQGGPTGGSSGLGPSNGGQPQGPWAEFMECLEEMADSGEEGLLLDAVAVAAQPMHALQQAVDAWHAHVGYTPAQQGSTAAAQQPSLKADLHVVHVPGFAPFQHEMLVALPHGQAGRQHPTSEVAVATDGGAHHHNSPQCMVVRMACMAVGSTWVQVCVPNQMIGALSPGEFLSLILHELRQHLGQQAVYVASAWSQLGAPKGLDAGGGTVAKGSWQSRKQMWILLPNSALRQGVQTLLDASNHLAAAARSA